MYVMPTLEVKAPQQTLADLGSQADAMQEQWRTAALLVRALADDPDAAAVLAVFQMDGREVYVSGGEGGPNVAPARLALGRAIRKVKAEGGPDITFPSRILSLFTLGREPSVRDIPFFKDGEPKVSGH